MDGAESGLLQARPLKLGNNRLQKGAPELGARPVHTEGMRVLGCKSAQASALGYGSSGFLKHDAIRFYTPH